MQPAEATTGWLTRPGAVKEEEMPMSFPSARDGGLLLLVGLRVWADDIASWDWN
jgi:hypothetical protein